MRTWVFRHHAALARLWQRPLDIDESGSAPSLLEYELVPSPRRAFSD